MMKSVKQVLKEGFSKEFYERTNIWNAFAQAAFHYPHRNIEAVCEEKSIKLCVNKDCRAKIIWIRNTQLGGYNWELCNMDVSENDKMAACAYLFSQCFNVLLKGKYHEGFAPPPPPPETDEARRERWRKEILISLERERKEAEERKVKIESGEIVLPDPTRPYEVWVKQDNCQFKRFKTARSRKALNKSIEHAGLFDYKIAYCRGDHEDTREFI